VPSSLPVGSERVCAGKKNNYIKVKVSERGDRRETWRIKHLHLWEQANGPIPKGHTVVFADGDRNNFAKDNLVLIPSKEIAYLGIKKITPDTLNDPELFEVARQIAKVNSLIREKTACLGQAR